MKKLIALALSAVAVAAFAAPGATAAPKQQVVEGTIVLPAPFYGTAQGNDGCFSGAHRRADTASQDNFPNGTLAYEFDLDESTWKKPFVLEVLGGEGTVDLDLTYYLHYPTLEEWPDNPRDAGTPVTIDFKTRAEGGEVGKVPAEATKAIVCLYAWPESHYGYQAEFKYTAGKGVKIPKS